MRKEMLKKFNKDGNINNWNDCPPLPGSLNIEVTNACNHNCFFCNCHSRFLEKPLKAKFMSSNLLEKLITQAAQEKLGYNELGFHISGESLLYKDFYKYVKLAKSLGFRYVFATTNGDISFETIKKVVDAGLDSIRFSINGATPQSYKFAHGKDSFDIVVSNVKKLNKYRMENGYEISLSISMVITQKTLGEDVIMQEIFKNIVDEVVTFPVLHLDRFFPELDEKYSISYNKNIYEYTPCPLVFNSMYITAGGDIIPCCDGAIDEQMIIGNVKEYKTLSEIWNGKKYRQLRNDFIRGKLPYNMCKGCFNVNKNSKLML